MAKYRVLIDTSVLISIFRGNNEAKAELNIIEKEHFVISQITIIELFAGCNTTKKRNELTMQIRKYNIAIVDTEVIERAIKLVQRYAIHHKLFAADAIIAANAILSDIEIYTFNKKDFDFIKEVKIYHASS